MMLILCFVQERIDSGDLLQGKVPDQLKKDIENVLTSRAHNMFLYGGLLLNQICDRSRTDDEDSIGRKLERLPKTLKEVYRGIVTEVHDDKNNSERSCRIAQDAFKWLLRAQETLDCDAFIEAISPADRAADAEEILRACRTLVVKERQRFEFAHYSVREYISAMEEYSPSKCHIVATRSCLRNLNASFSTDRRDRTISEAQRKLTQYALRYWPLHYEGIEKRDLADQGLVINSMLRTFLLQGRTKTDKYSEWFTQVRETIRQSKNDKYLVSKLKHLDASPLTPLFAACVFGLEDIVAKFDREPDALNKTNNYGQSALCLAIENQKFDVVKALLSRRFPADLNHLNIKAVQQFEDYDSAKPPEIILYATPLQCAASTGRLDIAEYLVDAGAQINSVAGYFGSPLQAAALKGHQSIVTMLLGRGAEPNNQGGFHGNALQAAAIGRHSDVINTLLENKPAARVDTPGGHYGSALMAAVCSGNIEVVWALLEEKANPNIMSKTYGKPLEKASMHRSHKEIVSLLLDNGATADLLSRGSGVHMLHRAALYDMTDLAAYCLDNKAKIDVVTTQGPIYPRKYNDFARDMSPLAFACAEGHTNMAGFLLDRGAPFEVDRPHAALLWTAAYQGHAGVVNLLINRFRASHTTQEIAQFFLQRPDPRSGHPVMFAAASSGKPDVIEALVRHGVKYESNWYGASPLLATATFKAPAVTKALLDCREEKKVDFSLNDRARNGRTALIEACGCNQTEIAKLLLDSGADYMICDNNSSGPLHHACVHDNIDLVASLVEQAAKDPDKQRFLGFLNKQNGDGGRTALIICTEKSSLPVLNLLLDHGADHTLHGKAGNTALHWACIVGSIEKATCLLTKARESSLDNPDCFFRWMNHQNGQGEIAMLIAAANYRPAIVSALLNAGADYMLPAKNNITVLHSLAFRGLEAAVSEVLNKVETEAELDVRARYINHGNFAGKTALMNAAETGKQTTMHLIPILRSSDALTRSCWCGAGNTDFVLYSGHPAVLTRLLEHGANYSKVDKDGFTALHYCAYRDRWVCVQRLMELASKDSANASEKFKKFLNRQSTTNRRTAVNDAALKGYTHIVSFLLDHGAEYDLVGIAGRSPLHVSAFGASITSLSSIPFHSLTTVGDITDFVLYHSIASLAESLTCSLKLSRRQGREVMSSACAMRSMPNHRQTVGRVCGRLR